MVQTKKKSAKKANNSPEQKIRKQSTVKLSSDEKTSAEKELENRKTIALIVGAVGAFVAIHFIAKPLLNSFGIDVEWWVYLVAILIGIGYATNLTTKDMAHESMALQKRGKK
ncbi:MAG: hypothetical protein ACLFSN_00785 [Candidatus Woesearchaeota archaeon]